MNLRPISEDDLQAYVDGRLDQMRLGQVEAYLAAHPETAARLAEYRDHGAALRKALAPIADEPITVGLDLARLIQRNRRRLPVRLVGEMAAAVLILGIGLAGGWRLRGQMAPQAEGVMALASEAANSYSVFASDHLRPVEIPASEASQLISWSAEALHRPLSIPDLSAAGYRFMGGRMVPTPHGAAVMLMYDDDKGTRLVMVTRQMAADQNARMSESRSGDLTGFTWARDGIGYSLVGPLAPGILNPIANEIRNQTI